MLSFQGYSTVVTMQLILKRYYTFLWCFKLELKLEVTHKYIPEESETVEFLRNSRVGFNKIKKMNFFTEAVIQDMHLQKRQKIKIFYDKFYCSHSLSVDSI